MKKIIDHIKGFDFILLSSVLLLAVIGMLSIYGSNSEIAVRQAFFLVGGIFLMFLVSFIDWRIFRENSYLILALYFFSLFLLVGLFFFAPEIRDVRRWYEIGPFLFDPGEVFKIVIIILLAKFFSNRHVEMYKVSHIVLAGIYVLIPTFLIFRQPDLGSALILVIMWIGVLLLSGIKLRHFIAICLLGVVFLGVGWSVFLQDYQKDRVIAFLEPQLDPQGIGWGQTQAQIAVGSGGFLGQGIGSGSQTQLGFLPLPQTDFIFAAIAEEMGFIGVVLLVFGFIVFFWRSFLVILHSNTNFPRLFVFGFVVIIATQAFINMGMNLGVLPIIGTPLPLVSYGGSNLLFVFLGLGIMESIRKDISFHEGLTKNIL